MLNGQDLFEALNGVDADLVREAAEARPAGSRPRRAFLQWALPAAAFFLVVCAGIYFLGTRTAPAPPEVLEEPGGTGEGIGREKVQLCTYTVVLDAKPIPAEKLNDSSAGSFFNFDAANSVMPDTFVRLFETWDEASAFIGLSGLRTPYFPYEDGWTFVTGKRDGAGELLSVAAVTSSYDHPVQVQITAQVVTDVSPVSNAVQTVTAPEGCVFSESSFTTGRSVLCRTVETSPGEDARYGLTGYVVLDDVVYSIQLTFSEKDRTEAEAVLHDWANAF